VAHGQPPLATPGRIYVRFEHTIDINASPAQVGHPRRRRPLEGLDADR
jgi:hypothetical protein